MPVPWMSYGTVMMWNIGVWYSKAAFPGEHYHSKWRSENAGDPMVLFERELMGIWSNLRAKRRTVDDGRWWKQILHHLFFFEFQYEIIGYSQYQLVSRISEPSTVFFSVSLNVNPHVLLLRWFPEMSCWCFSFGDSDLMVDVSWKDVIFTEKGKFFFM